MEDVGRKRYYCRIVVQTMKLNVFLIVGVLFKVAHGGESGLLSGLLGNNCGNSDWRQGVQKSCDGIERVVTKFPKPTYDFGQTVYSAYCVQVENLKTLANSTEPILSNQAVRILNLLSLLGNVDTSPSNCLRQLEKTSPDKTKGYKAITSQLTETIGKLEKPVNKVITNVQDTIVKVLKQFNKRFTVRKEKRSEKIDFKDLVRSARLNSFTIAFVAETAVANVDVFTSEALQAVAILTLISNLQLLAVHGANANMGSVLVSETDNVSPLLLLCFATMDPLIAAITTLISSASFDSAESITEYLQNYVQTINSYEVPFEALLGPFEGVDITQAEVNNNLEKK